MSESNISPQEALEKLSYLTHDYMPDSYWTVGGAFRYDRSLFALIQFMRENVGVRVIGRVMGAVPCLWSLDWCVQRRPVGASVYVATLEEYVKAKVGVELVFDNPFISDEDLNDPYALFLVKELARLNKDRRHSIAVANDKLAAHLRKIAPELPIHCHVNRLVMEPMGRTRTTALYNKLLEYYNRVCLHPADAVKPSIFTAITTPQRIDVVLNDPCLRTCPARREHLKILAAMRRAPYDVRNMQQRSDLLNRIGCHRVNPAALHQKAICALTKDESRALYDAGYRMFLIQSQQFRNELTLLWDTLHCMFDATPELSCRVALIAASAMAFPRDGGRGLNSGLKGFSFTNYE